MKLPFINRHNELHELAGVSNAGGLAVVFGRRRVGKSRLLLHWLTNDSTHGFYSQAIEASKEIQVDQVYRDIKSAIHSEIIPKSWSELLELLSLNVGKWALCLDEFPYLVASDPSLPSVLQRWIDHKQPDGSLIILAGSSYRMMHDLVLNRSAPLYGRARKILHIEPMEYEAFCTACKLPISSIESFRKFSLVGGIPKYWEFVEPQSSAIKVAEELFFGFSPYLDEEPSRILQDEGIKGTSPLALLEAIGRGARRPSEMASRLNTAQTNLSRLFEQLIDGSILTRELPFGESTRSTKKTLYKITDPTLRFWFGVYSPHRTRWALYSRSVKEKLIHDHASTVFEDLVRKRHPGSSRYWEKNVEFDLVQENPEDSKELLIAEVKFKKIARLEKAKILKHLSEAFEQSSLKTRYASAKFDVVDPEEFLVRG